MKRILISAIALALCIGLAGLASHKATAQSPRIVMEEMMVPSSDAGIEIYVRNKRREWSEYRTTVSAFERARYLRL